VPRWRQRATVVEQLVALLLLAVFRTAFGDFAPRRPYENFAGRDFDDEGFFERPLGPRLLLDLDWRTKIGGQDDPTTATGLYPGRTATEGWHCDEPSGNLVGEIAANALVPAGSPLQGRSAVGFWNGVNLYSRRCVELKDLGGARFAHASSSFFPLGTASYGISFDVKITTPPTSVAPIIAKWDNTGALGFRISAAGDGMRFIVGDGTSQFLVEDGSLPIGVWTRFVLIVDRAAGLLKSFSAHAAASSTALTKTGTHANAAFFTIGDDTFSASGPVQLRNVWLYEGAQIEGFTQAELDASWQHGKQATSPVLTTYSRASLVAPIVGDSAGDVVAKYRSGEVAMAYRSGFAHASKLGLLVEKAATNLALRSEQLDDAVWDKTNNITATANDGDAPDGTRTADKAAATAANGYYQQAITTTAAAAYTWSVWLKRSGGSDVAGRLAIMDGVTELAGADYVATDEWRRYTVTATAADTTTEGRVRVNTSGEAVHVWGHQFEAGSVASSYIPTTSVAATRAKTQCVLTNTGGDKYLKSVRGEIEATFVIPNPGVGGQQNIFSAEDAGANVFDRMNLNVFSTTQYNMNVHDTAGVLKINKITPAGLNGPLVVRNRWDSVNELAEHAGENFDIFVGATRSAGSAVTWTAGLLATSLNFGQFVGGSNQLDGILARLRIWAAPRKDAV
jgi:hypothetical protein